jgi:hypothetical protein
LLDAPIPYIYGVEEIQGGQLVKQQTRVALVGINDPRYLAALADRINQQYLILLGVWLRATLENSPTPEEAPHGRT